MRTYFRLLKEKMYFGFLVIICCACMGSFRGAYKEHNEGFIGVTQNDVEAMQRGESAPDLIGVIALASEQSRWHNFGYAVPYGERGLVIYCVMMLFYMPMYRFRCFKALRLLIGREDTENRLFINVDKEM